MMHLDINLLMIIGHQRGIYYLSNTSFLVMYSLFVQFVFFPKGNLFLFQLQKLFLYHKMKLKKSQMNWMLYLYQVVLLLVILLVVINLKIHIHHAQTAIFQRLTWNQIGLDSSENLILIWIALKKTSQSLKMFPLTTSSHKQMKKMIQVFALRRMMVLVRTLVAIVVMTYMTAILMRLVL